MAPTMTSRTFRKLAFAFIICVIVGAIASVTMSTLEASGLLTGWVRESSVVFRLPPAQIHSSKHLTESPRSKLNLSVKHLTSKSTEPQQTLLTTTKSDRPQIFTTNHANSLTSSSSTFQQPLNKETLTNQELTGNYQTVTYRAANDSWREQMLRHGAQMIPPTSDVEAALSRAATQSFIATEKFDLRQDVLQSRSVSTTRDVNSADLRVRKSSEHANLPLSTVNPHDVLAQQFKPLMSTSEKSMLLRSLNVLVSLLEKANVTYFLYAGTLLGSFRHRSIIPWDDDLDIIANYSQVAILKRALDHVPGYKLDLWSKLRYKFYAQDAQPIPRRRWLWPFIDIFFFNETDSRIFESSSNSTGRNSYSKNHVLPLVKRPFDDLWLPVPHNEEVVVRQDFDLTRCMSNVYSHKNETYIPGSSRYSIACRQLYAIYPFVFRNISQSSIYEVVKVGDKMIAEYNYL